MTSVLPARLTMALIVPIVVLAVAWLALSVPRWRQFSWRDQMDTPLDLLPKEARASGAWAAWKVVVNHREVALPSLVMLRVRNSGFSSISAAGIRRPLAFTFPGREVVEYAVADCKGGVTWDMVQPPGGSEGSVVGNRIILPRFPMPRRASFKLLVLLTGTGHGVIGKGRFWGGRLVRETRRTSPRVRNIAFGTALALLVGAQAGVALGEGPPLPAFCRSGQLNVQGSSAFAPAATQIAQSYGATCPGATIAVTGNGSFYGLDALNASGPGTAHSAEAVQVAMSDGPAPSFGFSAFVSHPVAVIIFAVVVNRNTGVFNLTVQQVREIFTGTITNWRQVGGANLPVTIVARASTSGTRHTFETTVLGASELPESSDNCRTKDRLPRAPYLLCEEPTTSTQLQQVSTIPGAIGYAQISDAQPYGSVEAISIDASAPAIGAVEQHAYPYWTVEHLYTYGTPKAGSLTASFLTYMTSEAATNVLVGKQYIPCGDKQVPLAAKLCQG